MRTKPAQNPIDADTVSVHTIDCRTGRGELVAIAVTTVGAVLMCCSIGAGIFLAVLSHR